MTISLDFISILFRKIMFFIKYISIFSETLKIQIIKGKNANFLNLE